MPNEHNPDAACRLWLVSSDKQLLVDPHQAARLVGLALVLDAVETVASLAVVPLIVVVVLHLPHHFKRAHLWELGGEMMGPAELIG